MSPRYHEVQMADKKASETPDILAGKYGFKSLLGEGTQGRTWLAQRLLDGVDVAVKELKFIGDFKQLELFEREAQVLQSLDVKGVPKLFESIVDGMGPSYLVQEYVPYSSLLDVLKSEGQFREGDVLEILLNIARILHELENHYVPPIIHRDIKPSNILYHQSGDGSEVFLIDFGAVANPQKQSGGSTIAGTFGYMAPEQLQGNAAIQSDYYGAGATALHLLTGVSPCDMPADVFRLQFDDVLAEKAPGLSREAVELLHILLAPRIEDRPRDAIAMISSVQGGLEGVAHRSPVKKRNLWQRIVERIGGGMSSERWRTCQGKIRGLKTITQEESTVDAIEYTYAVDGMIYCGFFLNSSDSGIEIMGEGVCPRNGECKVNACTVQYVPNRPYDCILPRQTVYVSAPILEKLFAAHAPLPPSRDALWKFANRLWTEEACAEHALFFVLARILLTELAEVNEFRSILRSFHQKYIPIFQSVLEQYDTYNERNRRDTGGRGGRLPDASAMCLRSILTNAGQLFTSIPAVVLHEELAKLWKIAQTMQWGDIQKLLRQTYKTCRMIAQQGPKLAQWADELWECSMNTVELGKKYGLEIWDVNDVVRSQFWSMMDICLRELKSKAEENASILEKPLELLRGLKPLPDSPRPQKKKKKHSNSNEQKCEIHDIPYAPFWNYVEKSKELFGESGTDNAFFYPSADTQNESIVKNIDIFKRRMTDIMALFPVHLEDEE